MSAHPNVLRLRPREEVTPTPEERALLKCMDLASTPARLRKMRASMRAYRAGGGPGAMASLLRALFEDREAQKAEVMRKIDLASRAQRAAPDTPGRPTDINPAGPKRPVLTLVRG